MVLELRVIACGSALIVTVRLSATERDFLGDKIVCPKTIGSAMVGPETTGAVARGCPMIGLMIVGRQIVCRKTIRPAIVGLPMMGDETFAREIVRSQVNAPTAVEFQVAGRCAPTEIRVVGREMIASEIV